MNPLVQSSKKKPVEKMGNCVELLCMSPVCVCVYIYMVGVTRLYSNIKFSQLKEAYFSRSI